MPYLKYYNGSSWVKLDAGNADKLGGVDQANYALNTTVQQVDQKVGNLSNLNTTDKSDIISSINEVNTSLNTNVISKIGANSGIAQLDSNGIVPTSQLPKEYKETTVVDNIQQRDAIPTQDLYESLMVYVLDASADQTVTSGAALYICVDNEGSFIWNKVSDFESMDLVVNWESIQNKPSSTVTQIDQAVTNSHTHTNKTNIDKISENSGYLTYDSIQYQKKSEVDSSVSGLDSRLDIIEGDAQTSGSILKAISDANSYTNTQVQTKITKVSGGTTGNLTKLTSTGEVEDTGIQASQIMPVLIGTSAPQSTSQFWIDTTV